MRGLIYKDFKLFFKGVNYKQLIIAGAAIALLLLKGGRYAGFLLTFMFSLAFGMQNIMIFVSDEKVNWRKYELTLPVNACRVVASKYLSVLLTLSVSAISSLLFSLFSALVNRSYDPSLLVLSLAVSIIVPLVLTSVFLPLAYWFGYRSTQTMGLLFIIPIVYMIRYFENQSGSAALPASFGHYMLTGFITCAVLYGISFVISIPGYLRRK